MWRGLCPLKILLARRHFSQDAIEHAHLPQQSASCDCLSQCPECPSVCLSSSSPSCSYGSWSSEVFPFFHFLSLSLNKRAVVVRSVWSTVDSCWQLMHWSFLHLLFSWPDNAVLYSLLSIHISSKNTELQSKAARARMECFDCIGEEQDLTLCRCCLAAAGRILSSFTRVLVCNMKSRVLQLLHRQAAV